MTGLDTSWMQKCLGHVGLSVTASLLLQKYWELCSVTFMSVYVSIWQSDFMILVSICWKVLGLLLIMNFALYLHYVWHDLGNELQGLENCEFAGTAPRKGDIKICNIYFIGIFTKVTVYYFVTMLAYQVQGANYFCDQKPSGVTLLEGALGQGMVRCPTD